MKTGWIKALLTLLIAVQGSEAAYRIAQPSAQSYPSENCLVLALGAPSRADGTASALQRFRVEAAVDILRQRRCLELLLSGGAVRNERIEAVTIRPALVEPSRRRLARGRLPAGSAPI